MDKLVRFIQKGNKARRRTVVCCRTDACASALIGCLQSKSIRIPDDVLVTGYNNDPHSGWQYPGITTMNIPIEEMAAGACRYLFEFRESEVLPPSKIVSFSHEIIERDSMMSEGRGINASHRAV